MKSYIKGIVLVLILIYWGILYKGNAFILLGITEAVFVVFSFFYNLFASLSLKGNLSIPIMIADENTPVNLHLEYRAKKIFLNGKVKYKVSYKMPDGKKKKVWMKTGVHSLSLLQPGCYEFELKKIRFYDFLGLFYWEKKQQVFANAIVLPEIHEIPVMLGESARNFWGEAEIYNELKPGYDPSEMFDVREFRDGDKLQSVHWKLSAKSGELMVRENSLPKACPVVLFLNCANIMCYASLSFSLMDAKCPHFVVWHSNKQKDIIRARVDDEESFYLALTNYMQDGTRTLDGDLLVRYKQKYRGERYLFGFQLEKDSMIEENGVVTLMEKVEILRL